jgi:hypothetical protein
MVLGCRSKPSWERGGVGEFGELMSITKGWGGVSGSARRRE